MKNSVILTLAIILFIGCAKDDEGIVNNLEGYDGYMYVGGEKCRLEILTDNHFIIFKQADTQAVLQQLEEKGFTIVDSTYMKFTSHLYQYHPEILKDCMCSVVNGAGNLRQIPELVYNNHLYHDLDSPWPNMVIGDSNVIYIGVYTDDEIELVEEYARKVNAFVIRESYWYRGISVVCTNIAAGNHVELANWFYETGRFRYSEPEMQDIVWL